MQKDEHDNCAGVIMVNAANEPTEWRLVCNKVNTVVSSCSTGVVIKTQTQTGKELKDHGNQREAAKLIKQVALDILGHGLGPKGAAGAKETGACVEPCCDAVARCGLDADGAITGITVMADGLFDGLHSIALISIPGGCCLRF